MELQRLGWILLVVESEWTGTIPLTPLRLSSRQ